MRLRTPSQLALCGKRRDRRCLRDFRDGSPLRHHVTIVTSSYRYKRPPRKRKAAPLVGPAIVRGRGAAVSERALIGRCALVGSFVQYGSNPHFSRSRWRTSASR